LRNPSYPLATPAPAAGTLAAAAGKPDKLSEDQSSLEMWEKEIFLGPPKVKPFWLGGWITKRKQLMLRGRKVLQLT